MTLNEVASDLFLFLVTFRRQVRKGLIPDMYQVRSQLLDIFEAQERHASEDARLEKLYEKGRYPLVVTADEILINANWAYSAQWEDEILEYEFFNVAYQPQINNYNGNSNVEFNLVDIQIE